MDTQQQQIVDRLKQANNILVTVSNNPSVDQLAACIGLTLALNKLGKHATAVFSGQVPNTLEFLQPEKTIEKNTDSLRDFIISLDKSKADKLRYKVEDKVVKIFITPYKTSINEKDLEFSQGDFNVDVVVALGVHAQADLDQAITAHGRILHDAVVTTVNVKPGGELGAINWLDSRSSSLCELIAELVGAIDKKMLDGQMATALLTGIVAETERFSNARTTPRTMSISAELMSAGANQQLVATKLKPPEPKPVPRAPQVPVAKPAPTAAPAALAQAAPPKIEGTLDIDHGEGPKLDLNQVTSVEEEPQEPLTPQIDIDREGTLRRLEEIQREKDKAAQDEKPSERAGGPRMILNPPTLGGQLTANAFPSEGGGSTDPLSLPQPDGPMLERERPSGAPPVSGAGGFPPLPQTDHVVSTPAQPTPLPSLNNPTTQPPVATAPSASTPNPGTASIQPAPPQVQPQVSVPTLPDTEASRAAVNQAHAQAPVGPLEPIAALNAQPVNLNLRDNEPAASQPPAAPAVTAPPVNPNAPPPGPPPMMPPLNPAG